MNRIAGILLALLIPLAPLQAQLRGKIAMVNSDHLTDSVVAANALQPIEIDTALPKNLDEYSAIFFGSLPFILDSISQVELVNFIDSGGKLYMSGWYESVDSVDSSNPLWLRVGITRTLFTDLNVPVDGIYGTNFASNIAISFPVDIGGLGYGGPTGKITPILFASPYGGSSLVPTLAYISSDSSIRVVMGGGDSPGLLIITPDLSPMWPAIISISVRKMGNLSFQPLP